jgi:hypothetical protein
MIYILIIVAAVKGGIVVSQQEYNSKVACEAALEKTNAMALQVTRGIKHTATCTSKG